MAFPQADAAVKAWARASSLITAEVADRSYFGIPNEPEFPLLVLQRAPGGGVQEYVPILGPRYEFHCWGADKATAEQLATAVLEALWGFEHGTAMGADAVGFTAEQITDPYWLPDIDTGRARYIIQATLGMRAQAA